MEENRLFGEIEPYFSISYDSRMEVKQKDIGPFPEEYRMEIETPVKLQFTSNCWAFSLADVFQSYLLRNKQITLSDDYANLSETHITYDTFDIGRQNNGKSTNKNGIAPMLDRIDENKNYYYSYGTTINDILCYLARNKGVVCEKVDPCLSKLNKTNLIDRDYSITNNKPKKFYTKSIKILNNPPKDVKTPYTQFISDIKYCLMSYSEVSISMSYYKEYMKTSVSSEKEVKNYFSIPANDVPKSIKNYGGRHRVTIVGWNDNYAASNFQSSVGESQKTYTVQKNGAFLVKNSWGTTAKWDGYFWLSYEDYNIKDAFCITDIFDFGDKPHKIYGAPFGMASIMNTNIPNFREDKVDFSITYTTEINNEKLIAIGVFCYSPMIVTVELTIANNTKEIISRTAVYDAGYSMIELDTPETIPKAKTDFKLTCHYEAMQYGKVFAPIEYSYQYEFEQQEIDIYPNIVLNKSCEVNGMLVDEINQSYGEAYGNVAIYAIMQNESEICAAIKEAYNAIKGPRIMANRIDQLTETYQDKTGTTVSVEWRLEPADAEKYIPNYKRPNIKQYKTGKCIGIVNTSDEETVNVILNCIIGEKQALGWQMSKAFSVMLPCKSEYSFSIEKITEGYKAHIQGENVPPGSKVEVSANNSSMVVTADDNGKWNIDEFPLYQVDIKENKGWEDSYEKTVISVTVKDDSNFQIISGKSSTITLEKPFTSSSTSTGMIVVCVIAGLGLIGLACAVVYIAKSKAACAGGIGAEIELGENLINIPFEEVPLVKDGTNLSVTSNVKGGTTIVTNRPLFENIKNIRGIHLKKVKIDSEERENNEAFGMLAKTITKGGSVEDCSVEGSIKNNGNIGGLFYQGEDVTVKNCTCCLSVEGANSYGGIAHTLTGNSSVIRCEVTGTASASDMVAGIAVNLNGTISDCVVSGEFSAKTVAGVALSGGTIKNCLSACKISAVESGYGIAPGIENNPACISHCISLCSHIGGNQPAIISKYSGTENITYEGIHCDKGKTFIDSVVSKSWYEFGKKELYTNMGWDMALWEFSNEMMYLRLKGSKMPYYYPFFMVAQTENGIYQVQIGKELILTGSKNANMSQIKWTSIAPQNGVCSSIGNYWAENNVFVMTVPIQFTQAGNFVLSLSGGLEEDTYLLNLPVTVVE